MRETRDISRLPAAVPGFVIGVLWLVMAVTVLWSSVRAYANDRSDWGLGWGLVGVLLLGAALSALVGTWWHNFRVRSHHRH